MDGGWKHLLEIQQTCVFSDTGDVSAPDCALKEALLALLTQMTSCITMTGTISAHSEQKECAQEGGLITGGSQSCTCIRRCWMAMFCWLMSRVLCLGIASICFRLF